MNLLYPGTTLYDFATNPKLFASLELDDPSWFGWNVFLKFYSKIPLNKREIAFFERVTGGLHYSPKMIVPNKWLMLIGRGGGKTRFWSRVKMYRALTFDRPLHPGQKAQNITIAPTLNGGMPGFEYVAKMIEINPSLHKQLFKTRAWHDPIVKNRQQASMKFKNESTIELQPAGRMSGRSMSVYTLGLEEAAHFKVEGERFSDLAIYRSAKPALARFGHHSMVFAITTPWTKEGLAWKMFDAWYGVENPNWLVVRGSSMEFNPKLEIEEEEKDDMIYYRREYLAEFVDSITAAIPIGAYDSCVTNDVTERPCQAKYEYFAFIDPASLSLSPGATFNDEFVTCIGHIENNEIVVDVLRFWSAEKDGIRTTPDDACQESIKLFRQYRVRKVQSDRYNSGYIEHNFRDIGIDLEPCKLAKSDLYLELTAMLNDGVMQLLDDETTRTQAIRLERRRGRNGKDHIDHTKNQHDDRINGIAGLAYMGKERLGIYPSRVSDVITGGKKISVVNDVFGNEQPVTDWSGM